MGQLKAFSLLLIVINVIFFGIQIAVPGFTEEFVLRTAEVSFKPWTVITSMFLHGDLQHLFYNMFALGLFGFILENIVGTKKFLIAYFAAGIAAGVGSIFFYQAVLGASGAIMGIQGYLAARKPTMMMYVFGVPMPMFVAVILWAGFNFVGLFFPAGIAFASHLIGLGFGILFGLIVHGIPKRTKKIKNDYPSDKELDVWEQKYMIQG